MSDQGTGGSFNVRVLDRATGEYVEQSSPVRSIGEGAIAKKLEGGEQEFSLSGLPKTFEVYNRAQRGNVKYWAQGFDSVMYPESATEDRSTWLGPGEKATMPIEAVLHFFGNIFHPTFQGAIDVIEACGGFLTEPRAEMVKDSKNVPPPRIIGGPLFLPDVIISGINGRSRVVFGPFSLYDEYDKLTRRLQKRSILEDKSLLEQEAALLKERLEEFRTADVGIYDQYGELIARETEPVLCDCSPIEHVQGVRGCVAGEASAEVKPKRRGRRPIDEIESEQDLAAV